MFYRPDAGPLLAENLFFLAHVARLKWAGSKRKTWQGSVGSVSWMSCWNWRWKMWKWKKLSCETSLKTFKAEDVKIKLSSVVVAVMCVELQRLRKWMSENFAWLCCIWKCQELSYPALENHQNSMEYILGIRTRFPETWKTIVHSSNFDDLVAHIL